MRLELADLATTTCRDLLGVPVVYTAPGGEPEPITGIFRRRHLAVDLQAEVDVSSTNPVVDIRTADLASPPLAGATVEVDGDTFEVDDVQPTGPGTARLVLLET